MDRTRRRAVGAAAVAVLLAVGGCASDSPAGARHPEVPVRILALDGPLDPPGPFAATTMPALIHLMRAAQGGRPLVCAVPCWQHAEVPPASVLIAVRYSWDTCFAPRAITAGIRGRTVDLDVRVASVCSDGGGAAARAGDALLAVPTRSLPRGTVVIRVRGALTGRLRLIGRTSVRR